MDHPASNHKDQCGAEFSESKVLPWEDGPFPWTEFELWAVGKERLLHQEAILFLWCLHCDTSLLFSPLHLNVWHKVGTKEVTEMWLCCR